MDVEKVIIIGSGPAGLTAAIYAARAALNPLCIEGYNAGGLIPGGQLMFTTDVENYPGFPHGVLGPEMMKSFRDQAERFGTRFIRDDATAVDLSLRPFVVKTFDQALHTHAVIIATGARANWLGLENEQRLAKTGGGVSACAVCDGALPMFRGQELAVVGGGDSAIEEASYLTKFARLVHVIHRRDTLRASKAMQERAFKLEHEGKLKFTWDTQVVDVLGEKTISALKLKNTKTGEERELPVKGLFMGIGHTPNSELFKTYVETDQTGYIKTRAGSTATAVEGVFACGDVADHVYRQAVTAAGTGCMAAIDCERWLTARGIE